ncbi:MAG: YkgJ family cysteine cluster protein [Planctomycetota bacterium]
MSDESFNLPKDLDFECTNCGKCCREKWEIRVDGPSAERLLARPWPGLSTEQPFKKRLSVVKDDLDWTVERKSCGSCVFLEAGNLCRIHREIGLEEKPQVCQQFPFLFEEDPSGVTVGLSHYCPGVKRVKDAAAPPLAAKLPELRRLRQHAIRLVKTGESVLLDEGLPLAWADYVAFEELLRELVMAPGVNPAESLTATTLATSMLVDFLRARPGPPALGAAREFVAGWKRMGVGRVLAMAAKLRAKPGTGRLLLRQFLSLVDATASGSRLGAFSGGLAFVKELVGAGSVACVPLGGRVGVVAVRGVELAWEDAEPLRLYAEHALFRRRLLPPLGVRVGLALLVLQVASMRYVARAAAALAGRSRATADDVAQGVQLVEKHYAAHSSLSMAFETGPARKIFRKVAEKPIYARAVLSS